MLMPIEEVIDRYTIWMLKEERIGGADITKARQMYEKELQKHTLQAKWINDLYEMNGHIWDLESDIRKGLDEQLGMAEIGRRAIKVREFNKKRIKVKNDIVDALGEGFKDVKMNHGSE